MQFSERNFEARVGVRRHAQVPLDAQLTPPRPALTLLFWVGGVAMIAIGMVGAANASSEEEGKDFSASAEEEAAPEVAEATADE